MKKISLVLFFAIFFTSCEQEIENPDLLYEQKLVIEAFLFAGETPSRILVSMTKHPLAIMSGQQFITDAEVTITVNGKSYRCETVGNSANYLCPELIIEAGQTYHLTVRYRDMVATATTTVPDITVDSVYYRTEQINEFWSSWTRVYVYTNLSSKNPFSCYGFNVITYIDNNGNEQYNYHREAMFLSERKNNNYTSNVLVKIDSWTSNSNDWWLNNFRDTILICDPQMYDYYWTRGNNDDNWDLFGSGSNPHWNVRGDGIGLFIGCIRKEIRIKKQPY